MPDARRFKAHALQALAYSGVAGIGFATDASLLHLGVHFGLQPAWARLISLTVAMQVTFWINGLFVFRCLTRDSWGGAWLGYMVTNGFGNFCNYWIFVTLVSLHHPILSNHGLALVTGSLVAWAINYTCARYLIFGDRASGKKGCPPLTEIIEGLVARMRVLRTPRHT